MKKTATFAAVFSLGAGAVPAQTQEGAVFVMALDRRSGVVTSGDLSTFGDWVGPDWVGLGCPSCASGFGTIQPLTRDHVIE